MPRGSLVFRKSAFRASSPPSQPLGPGLFRPESLPKVRRPYGEPDLVLDVPGKVYTPAGLFTQISDWGRTQRVDPADIPDVSDESDNEGSENVPSMHAQQKKERQWRKWSEEVIPSLIKPYIALLRETDSLRDLEKVRGDRGCVGCSRGKVLEVSCIFFNKIEKLVLCTCEEPALQLLSRGLFPCAPSRPSLAVDLDMLDYARGLFANASPNLTAWCETLEGFLNARKFKLTTRDSLRGRFGNALHWYACLVDTKRLRLRDYLESVRDAIRQVDGTNNQGEDVEMDDATGSSSATILDECHESAHISERPSEYLRERCPLCFGGENWHKPKELIDAIVCLDACFTQKRRKSKENTWTAPRQHPETVFIPPDEAAHMEAFVEAKRPSKPKKSKQNLPTPAKGKSKTVGDNADGNEYEPNIRVPISVLDACMESFEAADSNRVKASTKIFGDTGLMSLICRHDRVLWLVNMTSAGEKQFYALCLLQKLFEHIPNSMRIGCLYDINCQLHRSCETYGFLEDYLDRLVFAISVFHAYGHQWPCQIIYHPRKCVGFGLTDGEGCERFWSSIKLLIPTLRVSGYFNRIYTLDTQVKHSDQKSLLGLGKWLKTKWTSTSIRKSEVQTILEEIYELGITEEHLREEWKNQVEEQTKPLKRQSKHWADKEIEEILVLARNVDIYQAEVSKYEDMLETGQYENGLTIHEVQTFLEEVTEKLKRTRKSIANKKAKLSVDGRLNLENLLGNEFLKGRMNALALKQRIRDRLRLRKFELENLERAYRSSVNKAKLDKNAHQQMKRKEPGITSLANKYNKLCQDLQTMIDHKKAPLGAIAPVLIQTEGLFELDVDDDIWQDIGLTNETDGAVDIPDWLGNEFVRRGIKAMLEHDRCKEEERRLILECTSLQEWMLEEWNIMLVAMEWASEDPDLSYQLQLHKRHLLKLCLTWEPMIRIIPAFLQESWGPSQEDLDIARGYEMTESVVDKRNEDEIEDVGNDSEDNNEVDLDEAELLDAVEASALMDQFHFDMNQEEAVVNFRGLSPVKRGRGN